MAYLAYYTDHYSTMTSIQDLYAQDSMPVNKNTLENIRESSQFASDRHSTLAGWLQSDLPKKGSILGTPGDFSHDPLTFKTQTLLINNTLGII